MIRSVLVVLLCLALPAAIATSEVHRALVTGALSKVVVAQLEANPTPSATVATERAHPGPCAFHPGDSGTHAAIKALERVGTEALTFAAEHPAWFKWEAMQVEHGLHEREGWASLLGPLWSRTSPTQRWILLHGPLHADLESTPVDVQLVPPPLPPEEPLAGRLVNLVREDPAAFWNDDLGAAAVRALDLRLATDPRWAHGWLTQFALAINLEVMRTLTFPPPPFGPTEEGSAPVPGAARFRVTFKAGGDFGTGTLSLTYAGYEGSTEPFAHLDVQLDDAAWSTLYKQGLVERSLDDDPRLRVGAARQTSRAWARALRPKLADAVERSLRFVPQRVRSDGAYRLEVDHYPVRTDAGRAIRSLRALAGHFEDRALFELESGQQDLWEDEFAPARPNISELKGWRVRWERTRFDGLTVLLELDGAAVGSPLHLRFSDVTYGRLYLQALREGKLPTGLLHANKGAMGAIPSPRATARAGHEAQADAIERQVAAEVAAAKRANSRNTPKAPAVSMPSAPSRRAPDPSTWVLPDSAPVLRPPRETEAAR